VETDRLGDGRAVLHGGGVDRLAGDLDLPRAEVEHDADVAGAQRVEVIAERLPGHLGELGLGDPAGHVHDMVAGVEGEGHEAGGQAAVDALGGLDVVAVRAVAAVPALLEAAEGRLVQHGERLAAQAVHLADRLLGEHGREPGALLAEGASLSGGREPQPVPGADGGAGGADRAGSQHLEGLAQGGGVGGRERADEQVPVAVGAGLPLEGGERGGIRGADPEGAAVGGAEHVRLEVVGAEGHERFSSWSASRPSARDPVVVVGVGTASAGCAGSDGCGD
jgi:hypothetical protein